MKTLYIHVGTPKTGSTSLQTFCIENEEVLGRMGYVYPPCPHKYPNVSRLRNNGRFLVGTINNAEGKRCKEEENRVFQDGMAEILKLFHDYEYVILSDEAIWRGMDSGRKHLWEDLKKIIEESEFDIEVKIVVYLRRQDKLISSLWNQKIKRVKGTLGEESFQDFIDRLDDDIDIRLDYYHKLERMANVLGKENIIVRRFEKESFFEGSLYADFLHALGIPGMEGFSSTEGDKNPGLYGNTHEIKRILNGLPEMEDIKNQEIFLKILRPVSEISVKNYPCEMFSKEEIEALLARYGEGNQRIVQEYLKEDGTELFNVNIKNAPKWEKDNPYMLEDVIRFVGSCTLYLMKENTELREEQKKLRKELKYRLKHPIRTIFHTIFKKADKK